MQVHPWNVLIEEQDSDDCPASAAAFDRQHTRQPSCKQARSYDRVNKVFSQATYSRQHESRDSSDHTDEAVPQAVITYRLRHRAPLAATDIASTSDAQTLLKHPPKHHKCNAIQHKMQQNTFSSACNGALNDSNIKNDSVTVNCTFEYPRSLLLQNRKPLELNNESIGKVASLGFNVARSTLRSNALRKLPSKLSSKNPDAENIIERCKLVSAEAPRTGSTDAIFMTVKNKRKQGVHKAPKKGCAILDEDLHRVDRAKPSDDVSTVSADNYQSSSNVGNKRQKKHIRKVHLCRRLAQLLPADDSLLRAVKERRNKCQPKPAGSIDIISVTHTDMDVFLDLIG